MFSYLKSFFTAPGLTIKVTNERINEQEPGALLLTEEHEFGVSEDGTARIRQMKNGKFRLVVNQNEVIGTYARRRDAIRGAARKGLTVND
jgi:hypothetical protein